MARYRLELGPVPLHHQVYLDLRAALDWSHGLLASDAQRVFRRLSVFAGGFSLELALATVSDDSPDRPATQDKLIQPRPYPRFSNFGISGSGISFNSRSTTDSLDMPSACA